jgi:hypothetical protein
MQSNPPNAAALDYPTLTPAQREQRGRAWARSYRTLRILLGTDTLVILAAGAFLLAFGVDAFKPAVPVICGFLILSITLFFGAPHAACQIRPDLDATLQGVRVLMTLGSVYVLLLAVIDLLLLVLFWSVGFVSVRVNVLGAYGIIFLLAFFLFALIVAFIVALIERVLQQLKN